MKTQQFRNNVALITISATDEAVLVTAQSTAVDAAAQGGPREYVFPLAHTDATKRAFAQYYKWVGQADSRERAAEAAAHAAYVATQPVPECSRCGGSGMVASFPHISGGACFECGVVGTTSKSAAEAADVAAFAAANAAAAVTPNVAQVLRDLAAEAAAYEAERLTAGCEEIVGSEFYSDENVHMPVHCGAPLAHSRAVVCKAHVESRKAEWTAKAALQN